MKPIIAFNDGYYTQRHLFTCDELFANLPLEIRAAREQIKNVQCYGQFYTENGMLKCRFYNEAEGVGATYYTWYPFKKTWQR